MNRRSFLSTACGAAVLAGLSAFGLRRVRAATAPSQAAAGDAGITKGITKISKTDAEWRAQLSPDSYDVLRREGTERPFTSALNSEKHDGVFACAGCGLDLFPSRYKFDSGTGWPSFFDVIPGHIATKQDFKLLVSRTEYHCARCGGHQGHVFTDGPQPTGLRYCNNGVALKFVRADKS